MLLNIAPTRSHLKTREELALEARAMQALSEYRLVKDRAATYETLGYGLSGGGVAMAKQLEYLAIDSDLADALEERRKRNRG